MVMKSPLMERSPIEPARGSSRSIASASDVAQYALVTMPTLKPRSLAIRMPLFIVS